jgi:hypothetical protein
VDLLSLASHEMQHLVRTKPELTDEKKTELLERLDLDQEEVGVLNYGFAA